MRIAECLLPVKMGLAVLVPTVILYSAAVTLGAGGVPLWKRIVAAAMGAVAVAVLYTAATGAVGLGEGMIGAKTLAKTCVWRAFVFALVCPIAVIITELSLPDIDRK